MKKAINKVIIFVFSVAIIVGCASWTEFRSTPGKAKVYVDGELLGVTPISYYDRYPSGVSIAVEYAKDGYESKKIAIPKNCLYVHRIFWFPVLSWPWMFGYKEQYTFELTRNAALNYIDDTATEALIKETVPNNSQYPDLKGIILNDNTKIYGEIISMNTEIVKIKTEEGIKNYKFSDVQYFMKE